MIKYRDPQTIRFSVKNTRTRYSCVRSAVRTCDPIRKRIISSLIKIKVGTKTSGVSSTDGVVDVEFVNSTYDVPVVAPVDYSWWFTLVTAKVDCVSSNPAEGLFLAQKMTTYPNLPGIIVAPSGVTHCCVCRIRRESTREESAELFSR